MIDKNTARKNTFSLLMWFVWLILFILINWTLAPLAYKCYSGIVDPSIERWWCPHEKSHAQWRVKWAFATRQENSHIWGCKKRKVSPQLHEVMKISPVYTRHMSFWRRRCQYRLGTCLLLHLKSLFFFFFPAKGNNGWNVLFIILCLCIFTNWSHCRRRRCQRTISSLPPPC